MGWNKRDARKITANTKLTTSNEMGQNMAHEAEIDLFLDLTSRKPLENVAFIVPKRF